MVYLHSSLVPIREIGRLSPQSVSHNAEGTRNIATFMTELAEFLPKLTLANLGFLLPHLDAEVTISPHALLPPPPPFSLLCAHSLFCILLSLTQ